MRYFLFAFCLSMSFACSAQKLITNEVDRFTKSHVKLTSWETLKMGMGKVLKVQGKSVNDTMALRFSFARTGAPFIITPNSNIYILLENDESIALQSISASISQGISTTQHAEAVYFLSKENAQKLTCTPLKAVRIDMSKEYAEIDIKEKNRKIVQDIIKLLL